jgi:hypothetical protein
MKIIKLLPLLLLFLSSLLISCEENLYEDKEFVGKWYCVEYVEMGEAQKLMGDHIVFDFHEDNTYNYKGGTYKESGTWRIKGNLMYTKREETLEKKVQIEDKTEKSVTLIMNDNGVPIEMKLEKVE